VLPRTAAEQGRVTIRYPRHSIVDWVKDVFLGGDRAARIVLNGSIPWRLTVGDGASQLTADLGGLRLASFEVLGGVSQVSLTLPAPVGVVPIRIGGGASQLSIRRPAGVAARDPTMATPAASGQRPATWSRAGGSVSRSRSSG
jgi:hypothetical protein